MLRPHLLAFAVIVLSVSAAAAPKEQTKQASQEQPFTGTVTYESIEPDGAKYAWTLVTDGRQHGVAFDDGEKRWIGADSSRYRQGRTGFAEPETTSPMTPATSTKLPTRVIAGREANCLRIVPAAMPAFQPRPPDHLEACQYENANAIPFTIFGGMVDADIDAAFAAVGHHGVPASAALSGPQGVFASWTATKLDLTVPSTQALKKDVFLKFAPPQTAKDRCLAQLDTGRQLVKAAMVAQESNHAESDVFVTDLESIGFTNTAPQLYAVKVEKVSATGYVIVADGIGAARGDQWRIDESMKAEHTKTAVCR